MMVVLLGRIRDGNDDPRIILITAVERSHADADLNARLFSRRRRSWPPGTMRSMRHRQCQRGTQQIL